jgi:polysaccharide biosynthesis protein PslH
MRILSLQHLFPLPLDSGGKIKSYHTLKALASVHEVHAVAYVRTEQESRMLPQLQSICPVDVVPLARGKLRQCSDLLGSLLAGRSFIVERDYRAGMRDAVRKAVEQFRPDVVHVDHLQMARFVEFGGPYRVVLDHHNFESMIIKRVGETSGSTAMRAYARLEWPKLRRYEMDVCRRCDLVLTVSDEDKAAIQACDPSLANVECVPIGVDVEHYQPVEGTAASHNILSMGTMYWPPNVDSMLYFSREILPLIKGEIPDCTLTIAGQRPVEAIRALSCDASISVTGYVEDDRAIANDCGAFVVPLRSGSGVRVKILNALAMGLPVVSTSIGAEGLDAVHGEHLLIADSPEEFAAAVAMVLNDSELAGRLSDNGRKLVCERYSWERVGAKLLEICRPLDSDRQQGE